VCESLELTSEVTDDQEKIIDSFNKINSWKHVDSLCIDGASSMLSEVNFYNSGE